MLAVLKGLCAMWMGDNERGAALLAPAVAWAAVASGAANDFVELDAYRERLEARLGRARGVMRGIINRASTSPKRVVYPEGEEPKISAEVRELLAAYPL